MTEGSRRVSGVICATIVVMLATAVVSFRQTDTYYTDGSRSYWDTTPAPDLWVVLGILWAVALILLAIGTRAGSVGRRFRGLGLILTPVLALASLVRFSLGAGH